MSSIKIAQLQPVKSQLTEISDTQCSDIIGGRRGRRRAGLIRNKLNLNLDLTNIVQINNNINIQLAFNGDNFNLADLDNTVVL